MDDDLAPDWILQQALSVQSAAHVAFLKDKGLLPADDINNRTLTFLGCGAIGTAILQGLLLESTKTTDKASDKQSYLPTRFNACVRSSRSAQRILSICKPGDKLLTIYENKHVAAIQESDVVLLCCQPESLTEILGCPGMRAALAGKLIISVIQGLAIFTLTSLLRGDGTDRDVPRAIVRACPNIAAMVQQSTTVIAKPAHPLDPLDNDLITWIFDSLGTVMYLEEAHLDSSTALCASGLAFLCTVVESLAAGAIATGLPREESYRLAIHTMGGLGVLLKGDIRPSEIRELTCTPGGSTSRGMAVLDEAGLRGLIMNAVRETAKPGP